MVRHWLNTPVCGYLGSNYGQDIKALLQRAISDNGADALLAKLRADIPVIAAMPSGSVNLYSYPVGNDQIRIVIDVAGALVEVD